LALCCGQDSAYTMFTSNAQTPMQTSDWKGFSALYIQVDVKSKPSSNVQPIKRLTHETSGTA